MESKEFIQTKLSNHLEADNSDVSVDNNRYHYKLSFSNEIGWTWAFSEVSKVDSKIAVDIELWEIEPGRSGEFILDVREVNPRKGIDSDQIGLSDYQKS